MKSSPLNVEGMIRPSIAVRMIRHAESRNNEVYRDARYMYQGGTPDFDAVGWTSYVDEHRQADPGLSALGREQAALLADYLVSQLLHQAHPPTHILVSPMRRTLETIQPTLAQLLSFQQQSQSPRTNAICSVTVHGFYFESEGCHCNNVPEEGMTPAQIARVLYPTADDVATRNDESSPAAAATTAAAVDSVGFPDPDRGWWCEGTGPETRPESEQRAAKFYLWLCEYLDQQLLLRPAAVSSLPDAVAALPIADDEEGEHLGTSAVAGGKPLRRRRTQQLLLGHGDFMSLVLQRIVAGFGHVVENAGVPHRSAFVHWNTGITDLEYFGHGRFLLMSHNSTPHLLAGERPELWSGGSLKDGWSYLMPSDAVVLNAEVSVAFSDEDLDDHVLEQRTALKALYLSSKESQSLSAAWNGDGTTAIATTREEDVADADRLLVVEEGKTTTAVDNKKQQQQPVKHFIVKRGLQVVGVATYSETTGRLFDVAVRPSAGTAGTEALIRAVQEHSKRLGRSGSLLVYPRTKESQELIQAVGCGIVDSDDE